MTDDQSRSYPIDESNPEEKVEERMWINGVPVNPDGTIDIEYISGATGGDGGGAFEITDGKATPTDDVTEVELGDVPFSTEETHTKNESGVYKANEFDGATLAQKVENAITDTPTGVKIEVEPTGESYSWDKELTIDPTTVGQFQLDFRRSGIEPSVNNPIIIYPDSLNQHNNHPLIKGGHWIMPDGSDAVVTLRDAFRIKIHEMITTGGATALLAAENHDKWTENLVLKRCYTYGGPAILDSRPASVTGGSGTGSFINSTIEDCWAQYFDDFAYRFRGSWQASEIGFIRGDVGADNARVFVLDGDLRNSWVGPLHSENPDGNAGTNFIETGADYHPPVFRSLQDIHDQGFDLSDPNHTMPTIVSDAGRLIFRDEASGDELNLGFEAGTWDVSTLGTMLMGDSGIQQSGGGSSNYTAVDWGDTDGSGSTAALRVRDDGRVVITVDGVDVAQMGGRAFFDGGPIQVFDGEVQLGTNGANIHVDSNGELVGVDNAGNETTLT